MDKRFRLLFLTVMPSPYQRQLFRAMAAESEIEVTVLYYISSASDRSWCLSELAPYEKIMAGWTLHFLGPSVHFNPKIINEVNRHRKSLVVVSDYSALTAQVAMWYMTLIGRPWVFWGEMPGIRDGVVRNLFRQLLMLPVRFGAAAICAIGKTAVDRYRSILGSRKIIYNIPYYCDLSPFRSVDKIHSSRLLLLYCGQFIERKGLDVLLGAFSKVADEIPALDLLLVGGNDDSPYIKNVPERLRGRVRAGGFFQNNELSQLYAQADIFVLPSRHDGWGVVVNEALGSGLPIIVSDRVGSAQDLVIHGENGFVFESGNSDQLADYIKRLAVSKELRSEFGRVSAELAKGFDLDEGVRRWVSVCEKFDVLLTQ